MNVGELLKQLSNLDPQQNVMIAVNGAFAPITGVAATTGGAFVVIRGKGKLQEGSRFTIQEEGVIGQLAELGVDNEQIGDVLGRPADSVKRKRKALGY